MKKIIFCLLLLYNGMLLNAQSAQDDACAFMYGTNLSGLSDWGTEIPFVNLMRSCRGWYTKSIGDPDYPWNSEQADKLTYRADGYPTHVPQEVDGIQYDQAVATIWAITDGWPAGNYTVLWDGTGEVNFWGTYEKVETISSNKKIIEFPNTQGGVVELIIESSDINDPVRNIRVLMPGTENTYLEEPFYDKWLDALSPFQAVRFMDWGQTNNWGQVDGWNFGPNETVDWDERAQMDYYTWTTSKGIPYEMMIRLMNEKEIDGWVCVPHVASEQFNQEMAKLFRDNLDPGRHLFVEYSNETWNWIFGQTHWLNQYGCVDKNVPWPEGTVPYIQKMLDNWTEVFQNDLDRITRVVGIQVGWLDVAQRVAYNVQPESFDAVSPTYYFGITDEDDQKFDALGDQTTVADIAEAARKSQNITIDWIDSIQVISENLDKGLVFYEGGQHLTPHPFGEEPTYAQALVDIQRDTAMYNLYREWFDKIRSIKRLEDPFMMMNFSLVSKRSARYGSWGILETIGQDLDEIPAPKYQAIIDEIEDCETIVSVDETVSKDIEVQIQPNPAHVRIDITNINEPTYIRIYDVHGTYISGKKIEHDATINVSTLQNGAYYVHGFGLDSKRTFSKKVMVLH